MGRRDVVLCIAACLVVSIAACAAPEATGESWVARTRISGTPDLGIPAFPPPAGGCTIEAAPSPDRSFGPPPAAGEVSGGTGNDPYTATGAREVPGPGMRLSTPPAEPVTVIVGRPADPDEHVAARNPEGQVTGPVPPPKTIGQAPPGTADPGTGGGDASADPGSSLPPENAAPCAPGSGL